jgi:hypothetical protein
MRLKPGRTRLKRGGEWPKTRRRSGSNRCRPCLHAAVDSGASPSARTIPDESCDSGHRGGWAPRRRGRADVPLPEGELTKSPLQKALADIERDLAPSRSVSSIGAGSYARSCWRTSSRATRRRAKRDALVFGRTDSDPLFRSTPRSRARKAWNAAGLEPMTLHDRRHTYASTMIAAGVEPGEVMRRMGHSTVSMTLDRNTHALRGRGRYGAKAPALHREISDRFSPVRSGLAPQRA